MDFHLARNLFFSSNGTFTASVVAIACFFAGIAVTAHVGQLVRAELVTQHKRDAVAGLSEARARLEGEISRTVAHGFGIRAYVTQFADEPFNGDHYREIASDLIEENSSIRSIGLAPNNILRAVYPEKPNEAALGLNYRMNSTQWPAIREAMISREVVIAGPLELVQGGQFLVIRIPVFPPAYPGQPMNDRAYWGVATLILDEAGLMAAAGMKDVVNGTRTAVVNKNAVGTANNVIFGNQSILEADYVSLPLHLPGGLNWQLVGYPQNGWSSYGDEVWMTQLIGSLISLVFGTMAFLLISEVYKVRAMALHDPLTGLANRRLLEERMYQLANMCERSGSGFEIFYVDLDAFKPVNDNYGHSVGDQLLIEIGERLQHQTRQSDTVARVGGDEFIILTPGNMRYQEKEAFLSRLAERLDQAFTFAGIRIRVKASIGSASFPADAASVDDLLRVADGRMYAQKAKSKLQEKGLSGKEVPQAG
ncbi:sensor domain-containing diguanylate cyclase [Labrenzia sp. 011]|nr:sensor domain-containing diguanylate cyclase [Labrenzia sp. 011]